MKRIWLIAISVLVGLTVGISQTKKVLFDNTKAETAGQADWIIDTHQPVPSPAQSGVTSSTPESYWVGGISAWGVELVKQGCTVHTLTTGYGITYGNSSNQYDLSNYDMFIVCEPNIRFSAAEKTAILNYVYNGGSLFMVSDHYASDRNNDGWDSPMIWDDLGSDSLFGIHYQVKSESNNNIIQVCSNVSTDPSDPVVHGSYGTVTAFSYHNGSTMNMLTSVNPNATGHVWMNSIARGTTQVVAATSRYGAGKIAAVGDSSPVDDGTGESGNTLYTGWTEVGATDNIVMMNMSLWLLNASSPPPPVPPAQVLLAAPFSGSSNLTPPFILQWDTDSGATSYRLDLSTTSLFSTFTFSDSTLTDTMKSFSSLAPNTTYYWRVRGKSSAGSGSYSAGWNFTTMDIPPEPGYLQPTNGSTGVNLPVSIVWNSSPGTSAYRLELSTAPDFSAIVFNDSTLTDTTATFNSLDLNTTYYWRVRAKNIMGWSAGFPVWSFTTWRLPSQVLLSLPSDGAIDVPTPVTLRWHTPQSTASASSFRQRIATLISPLLYEIDIAATSDFSSFLVADTTLTDSSYVLDSAGLGSTFFWRVRSKNQTGWGAFSTVRRFTTWDVPPAVSPASPVDSALVTGDSTLFVWHPAHAATSYDYEFSTSPFFTPIILSDTALVDTFLFVAIPDTGSFYYWHLRAHNVPGWGQFGAARAVKKTSAITIGDSVSGGWALVSVPVIPADPRKNLLFPAAAGSAFAYEGSYLVKDSLTTGIGYWLRFATGQTTIMTGVPVVRETLSVAEGWNLLGSISSPVPSLSIVSIPDGIVAGPPFGFTSNYLIADTIKPMKGYWIKTTQAGSLIFAAGAGPSASKKIVSGDIASYVNSLTVVDGAGRHWTLRFNGRSATGRSAGIEAPPLPVFDIPDVRFSGGEIAKTFGNAGFQPVSLKMSGLSFPVIFRWNIVEKGSVFALILDGDRKKLSGQGEIVIADPPKDIALEMTEGGIPDNFSLSQNYPNPFNPSTTLRYGLAADSHVRLSIVSLLGQEFSRLVDGDQQAGYREVVWDGTKMASGVYMVRFEAVSLSGPVRAIVRTEKIILAK